MSAIDGYDRYLDWDEVAARTRAIAERAPAWARVDEIGQTREGRPLLLLTIGDQAGDPDARPGFWLDGGTHASEWTSVMAALYAAERWVDALAAGEPDAITRFSRHTVYVAPCISPDGYDAMRRGAPYIRSTLRPARDGRPRPGLRARDLDGDGEVRWMRWRHPAGSWVFADPENPIKMRRRRLDDDPADAFFVATEGTFDHFDGVRWLEAGWEHALDLNRNFPAAWGPFSMFGMDGGDFPLSEPESRAVVEAFRARPRIAAGLTNHTYTGCILVPPYRDPSPLGRPDLELMEQLAGEAVEGTSYRVFKIVPDFTYDLKQSVVGVWADTMAATFGVVGFTLELWDPFGFAGESVEKPAEQFRKPDEGLLHRLLDAFRDEPGAVVPWRAFDHPQLGPVELGGIAYQTTIRNPPPRLLPEECARGFVVADRILRALPRVRATAEATALGGDAHRVELRLENLGYLATSGLRRAEAIGTAPPIHVRAEGLEVLEGTRAQDKGWLDGWGTHKVGSHHIYPDLPSDRGVRVAATWIVRGKGTLTLHWDAGRGGVGTVTLELG